MQKLDKMQIIKINLLGTTLQFLLLTKDPNISTSYSLNCQVQFLKAVFLTVHKHKIVGVQGGGQYERGSIC